MKDTFSMEEWYSIVRRLKDESEDPKHTRDFCFQVYHDLMFIKFNRKLKDKEKFINRKGPEFDSWTNELQNEFSQELITEVLSDDKFWRKTLDHTLG
jgi:hypothetical protein